MRKANKAAFTSRRYRELMQNNRFECYKHLDPNPSEDVAICPHHHAFYEIIFVVDGDFFYEVEGRPYHLSHGDVILIDELQFHHGMIYHSKGYERYALWIHPKYMQRLAKRFPKLDPQYCFLQLNSDNNNIIHLDDATFSELQHDLSNLFESFWSKTPSDEVLSESYFAIILTKLNQIVHRQQNGEEIPTISAASSHVSNNSISITSKDFAAIYNQNANNSHSLQDALELKINGREQATASNSANLDLQNAHAPGHEAIFNQLNQDGSQIQNHTPKFAAVQSMNDMIATVNNNASPDHQVSSHGVGNTIGFSSLSATSPSPSASANGNNTHDEIYQFTHVNPPHEQGQLAHNYTVDPKNLTQAHDFNEENQAILPPNIASTGRCEKVVPYGYISLCPHSKNCAKHAYYNELLLSCLDTSSKLVSFASYFTDQNEAMPDVSLFDPDPELDNSPESSFNDVFTDSLIEDEEYGNSSRAMQTNANNYDATKKVYKLKTCEQEIAASSRGSKGSKGKCQPSATHERSGHDFQTLIMQGEGETPAPLLRDGAMPGFSVPVDDDEMHLNLKLSERLKLSALLKFINLNINENLSLDEISQRFNLSKFYLTRRFKELTGLSLHQFIVKKRLTRARYLISVGMDPYRAAVEAGFNNYSHFSRTFKGYFGQNPSTIPKAKAIHVKSNNDSIPEPSPVDQDRSIRD